MTAQPLTRELIIGTRGSALALRQAELVQASLRRLAPTGVFRLEIIKSEADRQPEASLAAIGGEGVFVKELEAALLGRRIDLAVHSLKDVPLEIPEGLCLSAILTRDDARDAFISRSGVAFDALPVGARIGTSSVRRQSQLRKWRSDLQFLEMRGNIDTRLRKLDEGRYDGIVLSACGLTRLGLQQRITQYLDPSRVVPEPGQGAIAIESRCADDAVSIVVRGLDDLHSRRCIEAERACLAYLGGGCRVPVAAYAQITGSQVEVRGAVLSPDGRQSVQETVAGPVDQSASIGVTLGERLEARGARELLKAVDTT